MNYGLVSKLLCAFMAMLALAFSASFAVSLGLDAPVAAPAARRGFLLALAVSLAAAAALFLAGRGASRKFFRKEALAAIGLGWLLSALIGSIPYQMILPQIGLSGAFFESASGLTTTGASVLSDLESLPPSLLFWRALSQWIGGIGVVVFFVAILGFLGAGAKILFANESTASMADFDESRVQAAVARLILLYLGLSVACAASFWLAGMDWFDALCHMFATVSTGGFSTRSASFAAFESPLIERLAILFMVLGATSFVLQLALLRGRWRAASENSEFLAYISILFLGFLVVYLALILESDYPDWIGGLRASAFQVVSIATTSGFVTEDYASWPSLAQVALLMLMVVGGSSGSTAGGLKILRLVVAFRACLLQVERAYRARVVRALRINNRVVSERIGHDVLAYVTLLVLLCLVAFPATAMLEPSLSAHGVLSAVVSCLFNIGPGLAEIGPTRTYAFMQPFTKSLLAMLMIMGRLELYAVLVLFAPSLWKRFD